MQRQTLYDPRFEHDACGVGVVARISGRPEHGIVRMALDALSSLAHRGAVAADGKSGDGAGIQTGIPHRLLARELELLDHDPAGAERLGVGMLFSPPGHMSAFATLEEALQTLGARVVTWRPVPVDRGALGATALSTAPDVHQVLVLPPPGADQNAFEDLLFHARKRFERAHPTGYVCSLSCRTLVYKALCVGAQLGHFYRDLEDPLYESAFAVFHQRYSTNTLPSWPLAQPFRMVAHNGEINTLWANRSWMRAREPQLPEELRPVLSEQGSDSANLDEALEVLVRGGRSADHALSMLIPPAWEEGAEGLPARVRDFYRAHAPLMEPWDGPAAVAFADGRFAGASLDRNGLRPCRYKITADGLLVAGSEAGVLALDDDEVVVKGRLGPGQMIGVDLEAGRLLVDEDVKSRLAELFSHDVVFHPLPDLDSVGAVPPPSGDPLLRLLHLYGYSREDIERVISPMAEEGKEPTWSMGDDTPIAPLARAPRPLYDFFRQRFAQVTNPAIDPLREEMVMSLRTWLGSRPSLLQTEVPDLIELASPVLSRAQYAWLCQQTLLARAEVGSSFDLEREHLPGALERVCRTAEERVRAGAGLLLISDRELQPGTAPLPMALVVGAVHHHLVRTGLRGRTALVLEAGDCRDTHQLAVLIGYGADAVYPWLALAASRERDEPHGERKLIAALEGGLRKVMSKMGISTVASYRAGQTFEILGLGEEVVARCFAGTPSPIGGLGFAGLEQTLRARYVAAWAETQSTPLVDHGKIRFRRHDEAEHHAWEPATARALQRAVGSVRGKGYGAPDTAAWDEFRNGAAFPRVLRDLLDLIPAGESLPVELVEPAESIATRFFASGMSLGALSPEAHGTLTLAMNRLGARSNTGEGGEDPEKYESTESGERRDARIKQVASGRFGVTAQYLAHADEIEIKVAQGSKPGEGGQLPGHKVTALIAKLRHTQPGVPLISPPPHHDIYSIEDLAQLIYDLKQCNPRAKVGVKLVAEAGVGTIAAGVAKAYADFVHIAGHAGGTGASPLSSIKHAGSPWELGLAETQQVLMRNGLRSRIRVRTDGGLMTGRDVVLAALLGAEEFGFGTAPLVAMGCDMARQCHLDTCPTGIATQRPELREKFRGRPEQVMLYFLGLAEEVRGLLAWLGLPRIEDAVGQVELLRQTRAPSGLDLSRLLATPDAGVPRRCLQDRNDRPEGGEPGLPSDLSGAEERALKIRNRDRSVGARLSGALALEGAPAGDREAWRELLLEGSAGQSFGAFAQTGLRFRLKGEANDYVGKGLSGGDLVLEASGRAALEPQRNVILGNVALYGATSGRLFAAGTTGERFAVRNSGADAVVEGVGDHGCEYMTGGSVVILGEVGWNFGAGMTGGEAFVLDEHGSLAARVNRESVSVEPLGDLDAARLLGLIEEHSRWTGSRHAAALLERWDSMRGRFRRVVPLAAVAEPEPVAEPEATSVTEVGH